MCAEGMQRSPPCSQGGCGPGRQTREEEEPCQADQDSPCRCIYLKVRDKGTLLKYCVITLGAEGWSRIQQWGQHACQRWFLTSVLGFSVDECVPFIENIPATVILCERETRQKERQK